jgi:hypothetical protein
MRDCWVTNLSRANKNMMIGPLIAIILIAMLLVAVILYKKKEKYISTPRYSYLYGDNGTTYDNLDISANDNETTTSVSTVGDNIITDTVAEDVLDHIDCNRVKRIRYQSPANSECGYYSSQQYGSPALKYPVLLF